MSATALTDWPDLKLYSGTVLRFPAVTPYEDWVDFMLVVLPSQTNALLVTTGYKAGLIPQQLPPEAGPTGAVSRDWLVQNWSKWVFPPTPVTKVMVIEGYTSSST